MLFTQNALDIIESSFCLTYCVVFLPDGKASESFDERSEYETNSFIPLYTQNITINIKRETSWLNNNDDTPK